MKFSLLLTALWATSYATNLVLSEIHAFNMEKLEVAGMDWKTQKLAISNIKKTDHQQVPMTSLSLSGNRATVTMKNGGLIVVLRDGDSICPEPAELKCLETLFPALEIETSFDLANKDTVFVIHPLTPLWTARPIDFIGTFFTGEYDEDLIKGYLGFIEDHEQVAIIAARVHDSGSDNFADVKKGVVLVEQPPQEEAREPSENIIDFHDLISFIARRRQQTANAENVTGIDFVIQRTPNPSADQGPGTTGTNENDAEATESTEAPTGAAPRVYQENIQDCTIQ